MKSKYNRKNKDHHQRGVYEIDLFSYHSRLSRFNTALKFCLVIGLLACCFILNSIPVNLFIFLYCFGLTTLYGGLPASTYLRLLLIPVFFLVTSSLVLLTEYSGNFPTGASFYIPFLNGYLYTDSKHIIFTGLLVSKALAAVSTLLLLILSTPMPDLFYLLERLRCPGLLLELMQMIYRFIFIMMRTQQEMVTAARARLGMKNYKTSLKTFGLIAANLLVLSLRRARSYYDALESRLYMGKMTFYREDHPVTRCQVCLFILTFVGVFLIYVLEKANG